MVGVLLTFTTMWLLYRKLVTYIPTSCHTILLKYTEDSVIGNSCSRFSEQEELDDDFSHLVTWIVKHGLVISKNKSVQCHFCSKSLPSSLRIYGVALSREQAAKYLGVHFSSNMTWSAYIYAVFTKCLKQYISLFH